MFQYSNVLSSTAMSQCEAIKKNGERCKLCGVASKDWKYCNFHDDAWGSLPLATTTPSCAAGAEKAVTAGPGSQCIALLNDGSRRCKNKGIPEKGYMYCLWHNKDAEFNSNNIRCAKAAESRIADKTEFERKDNSPSLPVIYTCFATQSDGTRVCNAISVAENNYLYCDIHSPPTHYPVCQGHIRCGDLCRRLVMPPRRGLYCMDDHDPTLERSTDPVDFRVSGLRDSRESAVREYRHDIDPYTGKCFQNDMELEHAVEIQCARDCYDIVCGGQGVRRVLRGTRMANESLKNIVRESVNDDVNLLFTSKKINALKFRGVYSFLNAYSADEVSDEGLSHYLINACSEDGVRLSRQVTRSIAKEIVLSYDGIMDKFEQENPLENDFCDAFHQMIISGMRLK